MGKKRKFEVEQKDTNEFGLPAKFLSTSHVRSHEKRLIVVLEGAQLETVKVSTTISLYLLTESLGLIGKFGCYLGWKHF